jgi:ADP-heptose:LPS heptosyltransferase
MLAPVRGLVHGVRRLAVLRPSAVGDFLFCLPAVEALRAAYPDAEIVLLGKRWQADFLAGRAGPVDRVVVVPPVRGVGSPPEREEERDVVEAFFAAMRDERFDLALQLHGGGRYANPFVQRLGARVTAGLQAPGAPPLDRTHPYVYHQNERVRLLEVAALVGAPPVVVEPRIALREADVAEAALALPRNDVPFVVLQPGATDARRRWPAVSFAAIGDRLAARGLRIAVNGTPDEREVVRAVTSAMRAPAAELAGSLSLGGLAALMARATLVVSNDTGPLHLAAAVGAPTVGIYWFTNAFNAGPLTRAAHRQLIAWRTACPVCGAINLDERCPHDASFVADVTVDEVATAAADLLEHTRQASRSAIADSTAAAEAPAGS